MSYQVEVSGAHQSDTGSNLVLSLSEATQQMSQGIPSLASTCWGLAQLCGIAGSQGVSRQRLAEFIRPNRLRLGHVNGGLFTCHACKVKMALVLESHNLVCSRFCGEEPELSMAGTWGVRRVGPLGAWRVGLGDLP